jgi:hypothetical protein
VSQQINLFNPVFLKKEKYLSALTIAISTGVVLLALISIGGFIGYQSVMLREQASTTAALVKSAEAQVQKLATGGKQEKNPAIEAEIQRIEAELNSLRQVSDVLNRGEMGDTQGYAEYLRAFARQIISGVWLTGFTIQGAGNEIALEGRALRPNLVPAYIGRLRSEPVLQGKSFGGLEIRLPDTPKAGSATMPGYVAFTLQSAKPNEPEKAAAK